MNNFVKELRGSTQKKEEESSCIWQFLNFIRARRDLFKVNNNIKRELDIIEYFLMNFNKYSRIIEENMKEEALKSQPMKEK